MSTPSNGYPGMPGGQPAQGQPAQGQPAWNQQAAGPPPQQWQAPSAGTAGQPPQPTTGMQAAPHEQPQYSHPQPTVQAAPPEQPQHPRPTGERRGPFDPAGLEFRPVSPNLIRVRYISSAIPLLIMLAGSIAFLAAGLTVVGVIGLVVTVALGVWLGWLIPRQVRAIGYAEAQDDLVIRRGILFRSMRVVPYGRMQFVDVHQGPIDRAFGVSEVKLHTAAATTDAALPGLPGDEAARLRDRLTERGEARLAGL